MRMTAIATWSVAVLLPIGFLASLATSPAAAEDGAFCISGFNYDGIGDCSYSSYAQCEATASGTANICLANPYYHAKPDAPPARSRVSRRRN